MVDVKLICGDCLDILPTLEGVKIDAVITDPPYGINHRRGVCGNRGKGITLGATGIIGDTRSFDPTPYLSFGTVILWGANWYANSLPPGRWLIWDKQEHGGSGDFSEAEIAWCNRGRSIKIFRHMWLGVQRASEIGEQRLHPTQKPIALMSWCLELAKLPVGSVVFDPFMGSGSTGIAAVQAGYNFIGIEIDESYFDIAKRRIEEAQMQMRLPMFETEGR